MEKKAISGIMLALLFISMLTLAFNTTSVRAGIKVFDDFNDNTINSSLWSTGQAGGPTINEINQRLEIFFPSNSAGEGFAADYWSKCLLRGDFDIQVDFSLLDWPSVDQLETGNGVRIGLGAWMLDDGGVVERASWGNPSTDFPNYPREVYCFDSPTGGVKGITPTDDMSGKLRLVRSKDTLTGYYFSSGNWVTVASEYVTTEDLSFGINAWSGDQQFMDNDVLLAFDNFVVNSGRLIAWPPEEEWAPMSPGEARPQMRMIRIYGGDYYLEQGESFFLYYGWTFVPTNKAYDLTSGQPETFYADLQDKTDSAYAHYSVTMNGEPLEPTYSFRGTCEWLRLENPPGSGHWAVVPRTVGYEYYIVFPNGLPPGEHTVLTYCRPANPQVYPEPFSFTTILHVVQ